MTRMSPDHGVGIELRHLPKFREWECHFLAVIAAARAADARSRRQTMRTMLGVAALEAAALVWQTTLARPLWVVTAVIAFVLAAHLFVAWMAWSQARKLEMGIPL